MQVILLPSHFQPLEQQNGPLADERAPPGHLIHFTLQKIANCLETLTVNCNIFKNPINYCLQQKTLDRMVLDIEDFRVMDVLGDKGLILIGPRPEHSTIEDLHEDASLHTIKLDSLCVLEPVTELEDSVNDSFLHKLEENFVNQSSGESCQAGGMTNQNTHMTCDMEYIFVEQISSALKQ